MKQYETPILRVEYINLKMLTGDDTGVSLSGELDLDTVLQE